MDDQKWIDVEKEIIIHYVFYPRSGRTEAHTHGLNKFGFRELVIRQVDQKSAALLNDVADMILNEGVRLEAGDIITGVAVVPLTIVDDFDNYEEVPRFELIFPKDEKYKLRSTTHD